MTQIVETAYASFAADCGDEEGDGGYNISENNLIYHNLTGAPGDLSEGVTDSTTWKVYLLNSSRRVIAILPTVE